MSTIEPEHADGPGGPSEEEILRLLQEGDDAALGHLVLTCKETFVAAFRRGAGMPLQEADLEERFFEALVDLWENRSKIDPARGSVRAYFFAIMRNRLRMWLRQERPRMEQHRPGVDVELLAAPVGRPEEEEEEEEPPSELAEHVRACMEELTEPYRTLLSLDAWSYPDPASSRMVMRMTGLPTSHVSVYRARARKKLASLLRKRGVVLPDSEKGAAGSGGDRPDPSLRGVAGGHNPGVVQRASRPPGAGRSAAGKQTDDTRE